MLRLGVVLAGVLAIHAGCGDDDDGTDPPEGSTTFEVTMTRGAEVPVCASAGAEATGSVRVSILPDDSMVMVDRLTYSGLSGPVTAAHIHAGAAGAPGPIVFNFGADLTAPIALTFTAADYPAPPPSGAPAGFAAFIGEMKAGVSYVNVHTAACPPGEVRAQLQ